MRAVLQRVREADVQVDDRKIASIGGGILLLLGISGNDGQRDIDYIIDKTLNLRVFADADGKMNRSLVAVAGELLLVSQFTLYGDVRKGRRPSYHGAAPPDQARPLFERVLEGFRERYERVESGLFQAQMEIRLINDGPVTLVIDSERAVGAE